MLTYLVLGIGLCICILVLCQLVGLSVTTAQNLRQRIDSQKADKELYALKVAAAKAEFQEKASIAELGWNGFRKFEVKEVRKENGSTTSVYFKPHDARPLPAFKPGQYLTFNLRIPGQPKPTVRCYSLSDCHSDDYYRISVKKVPPPKNEPDAPPGLASTFFNDSVKPGDIIDIKAPSGAFHIDMYDNFPVILIGGGIGITPVFSMLRSIIAQNSNREVWFFYGCRNKHDSVFLDQLHEIDNTYSNINIKICFSDPQTEDKQNIDYDFAERISVELFKKLLPNNNYDFYICGPPPLMNSIVADLEEWGVTKERVHFEAFGPATVKKSKPTETKTDQRTKEFKIKFSQSGKTLDWNPDGGTILDIAETNDIALPSGCRVGNCGTCLTAIKSGKVEYLNEPSFEAESGTCLTCMAIPTENIEIDA